MIVITYFCSSVPARHTYYTMGDKEILMDNYEHASESVLYTPVNIMGPGADSSLFDEQFAGCACSSVSCSGPDCFCTRGTTNYINGALCSSPPLLIYECHDHCSCSEECANRLVQKGPHPHLEVFEAHVKGWGLRCAVDLPIGTFVCEYAGEVISDVEARRRFAQRKGSSNYIFCLREHFGRQRAVETYVDPTFIGNIGRYINHSCDPNLTIVPVRTDTAVPKICLFTRRHVAAGTELTFDYGGGCELMTAQGPCERSVCYCASPSCRGFLPFDSSLV